MLAEYIRFLHTNGKSPATINLLLSAVKWMVEYHAIDNVAGAITKRIWSDIRGEGRPRERRRTDGLTWGEVERVCTVAESSETVAGLRDAAMISLMSDCLLRISEAVAVDVEDIGKRGASDTQGRSERCFVYLRMDTAANKTLSLEVWDCVRRAVPADTVPESRDGRPPRCEGGS